MTMLGVIERRLRIENDLPASFEFVSWKCLPEGSTETMCYELRGACFPLVKSGPRKGKQNYRAVKKSERHSFYVSKASAAQWMDDYALETGRCPHCEGSGQQVARIDFVEPKTTYRPCSGCGGTGGARDA